MERSVTLSHTNSFIQHLFLINTEHHQKAFKMKGSAAVSVRAYLAAEGSGDAVDGVADVSLLLVICK